ncbi:hypothetical protein AOLI_G00008680 [Acnodon oligacanthus]
MGCVFSKQRRVKEITPKTRQCTEDTEILSLKELGKVGSHSFIERNFKKKQQCAVCRQALDSDGIYCKECKSAIHNNCETQSSQSQKKSPARGGSVEGVMDRVMESQYDFDLIYITERIISVFFLPHLDEHRYRSNLKDVADMLKSKHQDKFLVINLSEKRHDICRLNPKVEEFGWPDLHAPPLDKICAVCKTMEAWLNSEPSNVVVLHCKGDRGKAGVIIAAYMHYSKISAGADQALTTVAMRKFCEDKISPSLQPSQSRYMYYFSGLLSGTIKINSSPLLLQQVHIPALPNYQPGAGYAPFLKIYQSLKLVYTSGIYNIEGSRNKTLHINIEPALLLKGDIMVKCYHRRAGVCERECVFRVQFHTCTVHGAQLWFGKGELDHASTDKRYPTDATVQLVFSTIPEQAKGGDVQQNDPGGSVDFRSTDPVVRWDSYENFNCHHQDSTEDICHTRGPLDGSLYAQVKKRRAPGFSSNSCKPSINPSSPTTSQPFQAISPSSDSGHSSTPSELLEDPPIIPPQRQDRERQSERERDRETAILDDGDCPPLRLDSSCCGRPFSHPHAYYVTDMPNTHPKTLRPKHHTLPCNRTSSPLPAHEVCVSPLDLRWDRGPYRELCFSSAPPTSCSCKDCAHLREDLTLHSFQVRESPGCASMGHSSNTSPITLTPSPKRYSLAQHPYIYSPPATGGEHNLHYNHTEMKPPKDGLEKVHIEDLSLQVQDSVGPPLEQEISQTVTQGGPFPRHVSTEGSAPLEAEFIQESQDSDSKDPAVTKSTSTTTFLSEPSPNSQPPTSIVSAVPMVQVQGNNSALRTSISSQEIEQNKDMCLRPILKTPSTSTQPSACPSERSSCSELPLLGISAEGQRLAPLTDRASCNEDGSTSDLRAPSPVPDGYVTPSFPLASPSYPLLTVPHVPYTGYTAITIPASTPQPAIPEKQHDTSPQDSSPASSSLTTSTGPSTASSLPISNELPPSVRHRTPPPKDLEEPEKSVSSKFVQDSSKFWYKPGISRDQAIAVLKHKEPGSFLIRDSKSFQGAYGLALKVATPPPHAINHGNNNNSQEQLVRHFLIESGAKGVKIKGCQNETYFGSLSALVYQHSITPVSLPCTLRIPDKDLVGELQEMHNGTNTSTAADLLKQGAACNVLYLNSVDTESLTGPQAISKAIKCTLTQDPCPSATVVHFKVSTQGITLTDNQRRLFFRRHYPIHSVTFSSVDPQDQRWTNADNASNKMFGFVARRSGSGMGNACHLFAELDPEQPATAIVNFINKVMLGPQQLLRK